MLGCLEEQRLNKVWVVLDLERGGLDLGIAKEIVDKLSLEVGDADGAGKFRGDERLHCCPGFLDGCLGGANLIFTIDEPLCASVL